MIFQETPPTPRSTNFPIQRTPIIGVDVASAKAARIYAARPVDDEHRPPRFKVALITHAPRQVFPEIHTHVHTQRDAESTHEISIPRSPLSPVKNGPYARVHLIHSVSEIFQKLK